MKEPEQKLGYTPGESELAAEIEALKQRSRDMKEKAGSTRTRLDQLVSELEKIKSKKP
ncbi:MAG: hypothetical protein JNL13_09010 [Chitinophagaceae bacterium]|nr:hypothetical protein [Chitinophagaceae bacterium]